MPTNPGRAPLTELSGDHPELILIIEDNPDIRLLYSMLLEKAGFEVMRASNGETALELASARKPDYVLMDLGLPDTDGFRLIGRLRDEADLGETPIIACTGHHEADVIDRCQKAGFSNHFLKGSDSRLLLALLGR